MAKRDPLPVTTTQAILVQVRDELRVLNARLSAGDEGERRRPALADGLRVYEDGPSRGEGDRGEDTPDLGDEALPDLDESSYCPDCDRTFASSKGLAAHNRAKHGG